MTTRDDCVALDRDDPLSEFRDDFFVPEGTVYLDGNSLGVLPKETPGRVEELVRQQWGHDLIRSWNKHDWHEMPERLGRELAPILGAAPDEVLVADSTSVNLFKLLAAGIRLRKDRRVIVSEKENFPTDLYMMQGLIELLDQDYELRTVQTDELEDAIDESVALVALTHVNFRDGRRHDMEDVTKKVHAAGALALWDLSHSAGAMPLALDACDVDLAVGCGYKYLNGGPGAPAYLYVARRWHDEIRPALSGWMGHDAPFAFDTQYQPASGIVRHRCGTPPMLSMVALEVGIKIMSRVDLSALRRKSEALGELFIELVESRCADHAITLISPKDNDRRGSQVSFRHDEGYAIIQALIARGVIGDFREPDVLRFGLTPLYLRFVDVWDAVDALVDVMASGAWDTAEFKTRKAVT